MTVPENPFRDTGSGTESHSTAGRYDLYPWLYDVFVEESVEGDVAWYQEECLRSGDPVLELGCGTGRVTIPLAEEGLEVVGLDQSIAMLEYARAYAEQQDVLDRVQFVQDDMASFVLDRTFPTIIIPFCTFAHLTTAKQQGSCLERVHKHLTSDGTFVLDMKRFDPDDFEEGYREWPYSSYFEHPMENVEVRRKIEAWHNPDDMTVDYLFRFEERPADREDEEHTRVRTSHHSLSTISDVKLLALLRGSGFQLDRVYGDHDETPFSPGDPWCCVVASPSDSA